MTAKDGTASATAIGEAAAVSSAGATLTVSEPTVALAAELSDTLPLASSARMPG